MKRFLNVAKSMAVPLWLGYAACGPIDIPIAQEDSTATSPIADPTATASTATGLQSPVPPDGPCNTARGQVAALFAGNVTAFAVNDSNVYVSDGTTVTRTPTAGGVPTFVETANAVASAYGAFAVGDGAILFATDTAALGKIPVANDPSVGPTYQRTGQPAGGVAFDGRNIYASFMAGPGQGKVAQIPIDGSVPIVTSLPIHTGIEAMVAGIDGAYVAAYTMTSAGEGPPFGSILKVALGGAGLTTLVTNIAEPSTIAVDDAFVYFSAGGGSYTSGGISRMLLDGSGLTTLSTPQARHLAVDEHAIYFTRESALYRMDKDGGSTTKLADLALDASVLVHGGNVYWGMASGGALGGPAIEGGVMTICK